MNKILFCLFILLSFSCRDDHRQSPSVVFTGEIVNPTGDYVYLFKNDIEIDSARLDENNRFSFRLDSISEGLHNFKHNPEYQYVYLQEGDSLALRLNTTDFDESLVFSGTGEKINNFLIEMFLAHEDEEEYINTLYSLSPDEFSREIDSLRSVKLEYLQRLMQEHEFTDKTREIAQASIDFDYYIYKELYPFFHKKRQGMSQVPDLPEDFYDYRDDLDLNNEELTYFRPYYKYINYHLSNRTYMQCVKNCDMANPAIKSYLHFNAHKLGLIDSLITQKDLRDNVFRYVAIDYLLKVQDNEENNQQFIEKFHQLSGNNKHIKEINNLYEGIRNIQPNKELPAIRVADHSGNMVELKDIARGKDVVFYFWSANQKGHFDNMVSRIRELEKKYPDYHFIGLNFNTEDDTWQNLVASKGLDPENQYRSRNFEELTNTLVIYPMNKVIIAKDSLIVDAFANLYTSF
ncbi:TlpA family protein disulfide reductase [Zeaxanthinibacter enoshimensis]|uniref:Thioredoxin domain-containing protein n=1 Tax=Zeaxanthinibacter enoshimensis TaxID=392009 RepID=A0A4R6TSY5_9FLAO|nr:DUF4369 domain-containing protein [Zeaxanthinibacter enoshimensis]TDQ31590.1 hypothetical protein CLV82_2298 [Zeaxanthinibacter enoshimensis]